MRNFEELDLDLRYSKARIFFRECMINEENSYLIEEIGVPLDSVIIQDEFVSVTFSSRDLQKYIIETKIKLFSSNNKELGWYSYLEDETADIIDDYLVFI